MARTKHLNPAETVIHFLGIRPLATGIGCQPSTIVRWRQRPDGDIPGEWHRPILEYARTAHAPQITAEALVYGLKVAA